MPRPRRPPVQHRRPDQDELRARTLRAVAAEADAHRVRPGGFAIASATYGDGYLAVAVAGVVETAGGDRLPDVLRDARTLGRHRLDVELAGLVRSSPALVRFLGYVRLGLIASCGRLELHHPPADLVSALGPDVPDAVGIHRARPAVRAL